MKKTIRILALVLALLMVACVALTGCGKGGDGDKKTEVNKDEWQEMTLNYWSLGPGEQDLDAEVEAAANELLAKDMPNTKVHWVWIPAAEIKDKVTRAFAASEDMDITWMGWHWSKTEKAQLARDENILEIDADLGADYLEYIGEKERKAISIDGKDYFFIGWQGIAYGRHGIWASKKLVEDCGYDADKWAKDLEDLMVSTYKNRTAATEQKIYDFMEEYCQKLDETGYYKDDAGAMNSINVNAPQVVQSFRGGYGFLNVGAAAADAGSLFYVKIGTDITKDGFKLDSWYESDIMKSKWENSAKWFTKGWIRSDKALIASDESGASKSKYHSDTLGTMDHPDYYKDNKLTSHNMLDTHENHNAREGAKKGNIEMVSALCKPTYALDPGWATMSVIPYTVENKEGAYERAVYFSNYLFTTPSIDFYRTVVYGREGQEWDWVDKETALVKWHMGTGSQGDQTWKYGKASWYWGTTMHSLDTGAGGLPISYYEMLKEAEKIMYSDPFADFSVKNDAEMDAIASALGAIVKEYTLMLENGYLGTDGWEAKYDEFIKKLHDNGLDKLNEKVTAQMVAYAKEKGITDNWGEDY